MTQPAGAGRNPMVEGYTAATRAVVTALAVISAVSLAAMTIITCASVLGGAVTKLLPAAWFGGPVGQALEGAIRWLRGGARDLVGITALLCIAGALPYTTVVKGHVAIEVISHRLSRRPRRALDAVLSAMGIALFVLLAWASVDSARYHYRKEFTTPTLPIPDFWMYGFLALCSLGVSLVLLHAIFRPRVELAKP